MHLETNFPLAGSNTLALHATAKVFVRPSSDAQISQALDWARAEGLAVLPLGEGSNIVLAGDLDLSVLQLATQGRELLKQSEQDVLLRVQAGENWHQLVQWTLQQGYYGLENLALIPGTVGAAPIQNIGAYGIELERFVSAVHGIDLVSTERFSLSAKECCFSYRDSIFKQALRDKVLITAVDLRLSRQASVELSYPALQAALQERGLCEPTPLEIFSAVVALRRSKLPDPAIEANAGSFFKNPQLDASQFLRLQQQFPQMPSYPLLDGGAKVPAAWLIEHCGWKGKKSEGVGVHPGHALVLVNYSAKDGQCILNLAADIVQSVEQRFGIRLEIEPRVYGAETGSP